MKSIRIVKRLSKRMAILTAIVGLLMMSSCQKFLDVESSSVAAENEHWEVIEDTKAGIVGMYALMKAALVSNNAHWLLGELRHGDFQSFNRPDLDAIIKGNLSASYPVLNDITNWRRFYAVINSANQVIERAPEVFGKDVRYTELNFKVDIAQARMMRALVYFYMVRIWGDVPLITTSHDGSFESIGRTSQEKVLAFAKQELLAAAQDLPFRYGTNDPKQPGPYYGYNYSRWRTTLFSSVMAYGLLAHISAWTGDYADALIYTQYVMDNFGSVGANYMSTEYLVNTYLEERQEAQMIAFTFLDGHGEATATGHIEQLTLAQPLITKRYPDIYVNKDTINSVFISPNDERFGIDQITGLPTEAYFINYNGDIPIFKKVREIAEGINDGSFATYESSVALFRLEEITLLRAEAYAVMGMDAQAIVELNKIRSRRGLPDFDMGDADIFNAIFAERRRELMGEAWRWYDLIRLNRIKKSNPQFNHLLQTGGVYWPVSSDVIARNPKIKQNPYWAK